MGDKGSCGKEETIVGELENCGKKQRLVRERETLGKNRELWDRLGIMRKTGNCGRELENCWKEQRIVHEKGNVEVTRNCRSDRETGGGGTGTL